MLVRRALRVGSRHVGGRIIQIPHHALDHGVAMGVVLYLDRAQSVRPLVKKFAFSRRELMPALLVSVNFHWIALCWTRLA